MITIKKLTASEISESIIFPIQLNAFPNQFLMKAIQRGQIAHSRSGYTNTKMYSRFYKGIEIVGIPDRIDNGFVYEFKTFSSPAIERRNRKVGIMQIMVYEFITGLPGKLVMYDTELDVEVGKWEIPFVPRKFRIMISNAIKLKKDKLQFKDKYKLHQKKARDQIFKKDD